MTPVWPQTLPVCRESAATKLIMAGPLRHPSCRGFQCTYDLRSDAASQRWKPMGEETHRKLANQRHRDAAVRLPSHRSCPTTHRMTATRAIPCGHPGIRILQPSDSGGQPVFQCRRIYPAAPALMEPGRNILQGPGLAETNVRAKKFSLSEAERAVPLEFFNVFNRANLNTPNPVVYASAPEERPPRGVITSTSPRRGKFN